VPAARTIAKPRLDPRVHEQPSAARYGSCVADFFTFLAWDMELKSRRRRWSRIDPLVNYIVDRGFSLAANQHRLLPRSSVFRAFSSGVTGLCNRVVRNAPVAITSTRMRRALARIRAVIESGNHRAATARRVHPPRTRPRGHGWVEGFTLGSWTGFYLRRLRMSLSWWIWIETIATKRSSNARKRH